jgi:hypothetical protein
MRAREFITEKWSKKYKSSINCSNPKGFSQKAHCAGRKKNEDVEEASYPGNIGAMEVAKFYMIASPEQKKQVQQLIANKEFHTAWKIIQKATGVKLQGKEFAENFADGKNPGRKGLAKRSGVNTKASVSSLRKTAKNSTGEKARMAHWLANMKSGKKK